MQPPSMSRTNIVSSFARKHRQWSIRADCAAYVPTVVQQADVQYFFEFLEVLCRKLAFAVFLAQRQLAVVAQGEIELLGECVKLADQVYQDVLQVCLAESEINGSPIHGRTPGHGK